MRGLFIGKPIHWLIWIVIVPVLVIMGRGYLHVRDYNWFLLVLGTLGASAVLTVLLTTRKDEPVTREPFAEGEWQQGTIDE